MVRVISVAALILGLFFAGISDAVCGIPGRCDEPCCAKTPSGLQPSDDAAPCCHLPDGTLTTSPRVVQPLAASTIFALAGPRAPSLALAIAPPLTPPRGLYLANQVLLL